MNDKKTYEKNTTRIIAQFHASLLRSRCKALEDYAKIDRIETTDPEMDRLQDVVDRCQVALYEATIVLSEYCQKRLEDK